jgi:hypothetical protein
MYRVERIREPGSDYGTHKTLAAAHKRIARLVAMSNGRLKASDFICVSE